MALHLFLLPANIIFAAQVNQGSFTYPIAEVAYDNVTDGAPTNVQVGHTVLFGLTPGGDELGRGYARDLVSPPTLYFGRSSYGTRDGQVALSNDAYITVLEDHRVWMRPPRIDGTTIYKDHDIAVGDYGSEQPPVANCGPWRAGTIDSGTGKLTLNFSASNSFAVADGATITGYLWAPGDGTITAGTVTTEDITIDFDPGYSWVTLTVDDSNGQSHTAVCLVVARDPDADVCIQSWEVEGAQRIGLDGQTISFRLYDDVPRSTYPDGTAVMLFEEPADADDFANVLFWGWEYTNPNAVRATQTGTLKDSTIDCIDVAGRLKTLPGFPQVIGNVAASTKWSEMVDLNMDKLIHHLLHWHSTALTVADYFPSDTGATYQMVQRETDGGTLWEQVNQQATAMIPDHLFVCNRHGQLKIVPDWMLLDVGSRPSPSGQTFDTARWGEMEMVYTRPPRVHWVRRGAVVASNDIADENAVIDTVFCIAPGEAPGQGATAHERNDGLVVDQTALNACEGHRYARLNSPFGRFRIRAAAPFYRGEAGTQMRLIDYDPADLARIALAIESSLQPPRGVGFTSSKLGMLHEMTISYRDGKEGLVRHVEFEWEAETSGAPATTYTPPTPG